MREIGCLMLTTALLVAGSAVAASSPGGAGKIYCWKNAQGKMECGDREPAAPAGAVRELNKRGVTVDTKDAAAGAEQLKARQQEDARKQAEKEQAERQHRADRALLDTFTNEQEIELKRKRDIGAIDVQLGTLETNLKKIAERRSAAQRQVDESTRSKKPVPPNLQDEIARSDREQGQISAQLYKYRQEIAALNKQYDEYLKRYRELKGAAAPLPGGQTGSAPAAKSAK